MANLEGWLVTLVWPATMTPRMRVRALWSCYGLSGATIACGALMAVHASPRPLDWTRTAISALASRKHCPEGSVWFAGGLGIGLALLWPVAAAVSAVRGPFARGARWAGTFLRAGLFCGMLVAAERIAFFHFSELVHKGHEALAVAAFLGIYAGEIGLELDHVRQRTSGRWMTGVVLLPLIAAAVLLLLLYLEQRHIGWLEHDWSRDAQPIWSRFPFWQWIATATLWAGMGHLLFLAGRSGRSAS